MFFKDLKAHRYHYTLLIIIESLLLSAFVTSHDATVRVICALSVGVFYFLWGVFTHSGKLTTLRLMLEYALVGLLGSTMLIILIKSI